MGFTGEPVPPTIGSGATVSRNSWRLQLSAYREDTVEVGPVQQREPHGADAELVQWKGKVGVGPGQQLDAVTSEQRHVTFPQPQHSVDPEPRPAIDVAVVGIVAVRVVGLVARRVVRPVWTKSASPAWTVRSAVCSACSSSARVITWSAGSHGTTAGSSDVEQHASGEDAVSRAR